MGRSGAAPLLESGFFVDGATCYYGLEDFDFCVVGGRDLRQVFRKNQEVGVFACFQLALLPFLEFGVGRAGGVGTNAIFERNFFLRLPTAGGRAVWQLARDAG